MPIVALGSEVDRAMMLEQGKIRAEQRELFEIVKTDSPRRWNAIREIYLLQESRQGGMGRYPYFVDWSLIFTPIEEDAWFSIRAFGLPFFPQYPAGRFFVDFGDPKKKIAIECDGKQFHNPEKDAKRDRELLELGWSVYRFPGWALRKGEDDPEAAHHGIKEIGERYYWDRFVEGDE